MLVVRLKQFPPTDKATIFFPPLLDDHETVGVSGQAHLEGELAIGTMHHNVSRPPFCLVPVPIVGANHSDHVTDVVRPRADAVDFDWRIKSAQLTTQASVSFVYFELMLGLRSEFCPNSGRIGSSVSQQLRSQACDREQTEKQVLGSNVAMIQPIRFLGSSLQNCPARITQR